MKDFLKIFLAISVVIAMTACSSDDTDKTSQDDSNEIIGVNNKEEPKITYCLPRYITEQETRTIYEVFTGDEMPYGHLIMRSQPKKREGMYFFVMFGYKPDAIGLACRFILEVDSNRHPHPRTFVFDIPETHSVFREVKLGLTGNDWNGSEEKVNAWRLTLISPTGKIITQSQSWLWSVKYGDSKLKLEKSEQ